MVVALRLASIQAAKLYVLVSFLGCMWIIARNSSTVGPLESSVDIILYLHNDMVIRPEAIQVGDILKGDTNKRFSTHIQNIQRHGLYAPATEDGKICVSVVFVIDSSYISLLNEDSVSPKTASNGAALGIGPSSISL
jgi:hypothetical protein